MLNFFINIITLMIKLMFYMAIFGLIIIYFIIKGIINLIKYLKNKRSNKKNKYKSTTNNYESVINPDFKPKVDKKGNAFYDYNDLAREYQYVKYDDYNSAKINNTIITKDKEIINNEESNTKEYNQVFIKLYLNKNNENIITNNKLNTNLLKISNYECDLSVKEITSKYILLTDKNDTFMYYHKIINKVLNYCKDDSYFIVGHNQEEYKFIYRNNQISLEGLNENEEYIKLKTSILTTYKTITRYTLNMKSKYNELPYCKHSIEWDDLTKIINKLKNDKLSEVEKLPYLNEIDNILRSSLSKLKEEYNKYIPKNIKETKEDDNYNLDIYISKYYQEIIKDNDLCYKKVGLDNIDLYSLYADDTANYIEISISEDTCKDYSCLLKGLFEYCGGDMYAVYNYKDISYKFTLDNSKCYINNYSYHEIKTKYDKLKNEIINIVDILDDKLIFIEGDYDYQILYENGDFDEYRELATNLRETKEMSIFEIPYLEEATSNLKKMETEINKIYVPKRNQGLHDFYYEEIPYKEEQEIKPAKKEEKPKKKELSEEEKRFEKEADYYNLTKREREICKLENMTPEEFVEAEEDMDQFRDDEW